MTDQPGPDRIALVAHDQAEIIVPIILEKRGVVVAERLVDRQPVCRRWVLFDAEPAPERQIHLASPIAHGFARPMLSSLRKFRQPSHDHRSRNPARYHPPPLRETGDG